MIVDYDNMSPLERYLSLFTRMRPREGASVVIFALYGFLLVASYYVLKTVRESLILTEFDAEARSYAVAVIAVLLVFLVPLYGLLYRSTTARALINWITALFVANIAVFYLMGHAGMDIGFTYFVFVGIFGVMAIAQFWAFAADSYNVKAGQRLFPIIMFGASLGGLAGAQLTKWLTREGLVEPLGMLLVGAALLGSTMLLGQAARARVPESSRCEDCGRAAAPSGGLDRRALLGGFALVMRSRYLLLIAVMMILLNWVNTAGETILADFVGRWAEREASGDVALKRALISGFYGDLFFWVSLLGVIAQALLVSRIYRWVGISGALLVLPVIAALGYGLMAFVPVFSVISIVKIVENATDYSLMNTTRQALYLPTERALKYEGKTAVDTFFWRLGDLVQAGAFYLGLNWFGLSIAQFAIVNMVLAIAWLGVALRIGREYPRLVRANVVSRAPELARPLPDALAPPGRELSYTIPSDAFVDADPGDVLRLYARLPGGEPLPEWLSFSAAGRRFRGHVPADARGSSVIEVLAVDVDGLSVSATFELLHHADT